MRLVISDVETNKLENPDKMWLFGGIDYKTKERFRFDIATDPKAKDEAIKWAEGVDLWVGHNFLVFDAPQINRLVQPKLIDPKKVLDTLVISRTIDYDIPSPKGTNEIHSLKAWGIRLGKHKGDFTDFENFSQEMVDYWESDLDATEALFDHFKPYVYDPDWKRALRCEHDTTIELVRQNYYGFHFNSEKAKKVLEEVQERMDNLDEVFEADFPAELTLVNTIQYRKTKDGEEFATVKKAKERYALTEVKGDTLACYDFIPFKPGSPKQRIDKLWEAGWKPFERTKTHQKFDRLKVGDPYGKTVPSMSQEFYDKKKKELNHYGWVCNEDNLSTLPEKAPDGAKALAQWLTLEGRRSSIVEWLGQVREDDRIHGTILSIGAWTGRGSHKNPNTANISRVFHGEPRSAVEQIKSEFDYRLRECWDVPEGSWLVGADADGIQLRILGDYIWRHFDQPEYAKAIVEGRKEDETDIHNMNRKALGLNHLTRDDAKTFIYAWVLNAGIPKIASILRCDIPLAVTAKDNFERSIAGLGPFKNDLIPYIAKQGYFKGYDGRKVKVPSLHKTLAGILQNGEAVVMKHAMQRWMKEARSEGITFKLSTWVHDEWQVEVIGGEDEAHRLGELMKDSIRHIGVDLGFYCPLEGSYSVGKNWRETH